MPPLFKAVFMARLHLPAIKDLQRPSQSLCVAKRDYTADCNQCEVIWPQCLIPWTMSLGKAPEDTNIFSVGHRSGSRCCNWGRDQSSIGRCLSSGAWHRIVAWSGQCATDSELGHKCCGHHQHHGVVSAHKHQVTPQKDNQNPFVYNSLRITREENKCKQMGFLRLRTFWVTRI